MAGLPIYPNLNPDPNHYPDHMQILNLSDNRLALPSSREESSCLPLLPSLKALVLNDCSVSWHQVGVPAVGWVWLG